MIKNFGLVLRYTNKAMFNESNRVIAEIREILQKQSQAKSTKDIQEQHIKQMIADYEQKIAQLQQSQGGKEGNPALFNLIQEMKTEITALKKSSIQATPVQATPVQATQKSIAANKTKNWALLLPLLLVAGFIGHKVLSSTPDTTTTTQIPPQQIVEQTVKETEASNAAPTLKAPPKQKIAERTAREIKKAPEQVAPSTSTNTYTEGQTIDVCGVVSEATGFNGGTYLNLNGKFPNQEITLTVWNHDDLDDYIGRRVCTYGKVQQYKGRSSINVNNLKGIKVQ